MLAGDEALKVVFIQASLNLPYDHRIHVQNFTVQVSLTKLLNFYLQGQGSNLSDCTFYFMSCMNRMPRMPVLLTNEQREEVGLYL